MTDYQFPPGWPAYTDEEKCQWYHEERALQQALRQDTAFARRYRDAKRRHERRVAARPETVDVEAHR